MLQLQKAKSNRSRKLLTATSAKSSREARSISSGVLLEPPMVAPVASLQLLKLIPHIVIRTLDAPLATTLEFAYSAFGSPSAAPFALVFDPSQFVKKRDFDRLEVIAFQQVY